MELRRGLVSEIHASRTFTMNSSVGTALLPTGGSPRGVTVVGLTPQREVGRARPGGSDPPARGSPCPAGGGSTPQRGICRRGRGVLRRPRAGPPLLCFMFAKPRLRSRLRRSVASPQAAEICSSNDYLSTYTQREAKRSANQSASAAKKRGTKVQSAEGAPPRGERNGAESDTLLPQALYRSRVNQPIWRRNEPAGTIRDRDATDGCGARR